MFSILRTARVVELTPSNRSVVKGMVLTGCVVVMSMTACVAKVLKRCIVVSIVRGFANNYSITTTNNAAVQHHLNLTWNRKFKFQVTSLQLIIILRFRMNGDEMCHVAVIIYEFFFFVMDDIGDDLVGSGLIKEE